MNLNQFSLPSTAGRVPAHTAAETNEAIRRATQKRLDSIGHNPAKIEERLLELEREWDIERMLESNAALVALTGLTLGVTKSKWWLLIPIAVTGFLFQHATQGWCPPLPILRSLGFRTSREIETERVILKARVGDLKDLKNLSSEKAMNALWN